MICCSIATNVSHRHPFSRVKLFYTGPVVNAEMLVVMLEKHGIAATQAFVDTAAPDDGDLSCPAQVFVPEADYDAPTRSSAPGARTSFDPPVFPAPRARLHLRSARRWAIFPP